LQGYLLDVNHVGPIYRNESVVIAKMQSLPPNSPIWVCTITVGEIEAGNRMATTTDPTKRSDFTAFVNATLLPNALAISQSTGLYYAQIVGRIWRLHPPKPKTRTEVHLVSLGVDINDVWTVAVAWEHGLTFLTTDTMAVIRAVVTPKEVTFDNWLI
jgi:predicted nucleic acid-binding protein